MVPVELQSTTGATLTGAARDSVVGGESKENLYTGFLVLKLQTWIDFLFSRTITTLCFLEYFTIKE